MTCPFYLVDNSTSFIFWQVTYSHTPVVNCWLSWKRVMLRPRPRPPTHNANKQNTAIATTVQQEQPRDFPGLSCETCPLMLSLTGWRKSTILASFPFIWPTVPKKVLHLQLIRPWVDQISNKAFCLDYLPVSLRLVLHRLLSWNMLVARDN